MRSRPQPLAACRPTLPASSYDLPHGLSCGPSERSSRPHPYPPNTEAWRNAEALHKELRDRLLALPYRAFLQTVLHLMSAWGYDRVAPTGRAAFKGRNTAGGWDLEADGAGEDGEAVRAIAQVKQFGTLPVQQRMVDELRGCLLRAHAHEAWLITLSAFSGPARIAALSGGGAAPVRLLDGEGLAEQMVQHEVGVCRSGQGWAVNDVYFRMLERRFAKSTGEGRSGREASDRRPRTEPGATRGGAVPPAHIKTADTPRGSGPAAIVRVTVLCGRFLQD